MLLTLGFYFIPHLLVLKTSVQWISFFSLLLTKKKKKLAKKSMTFNSALLICLDNAAIELCFCQW